MSLACTRTGTLSALIRFILKAALWNRCCYSYLMDEETAPKRLTNLPRSTHLWESTEICALSDSKTDPFSWCGSWQWKSNVCTRTQQTLLQKMNHITNGGMLSSYHCRWFCAFFIKHTALEYAIIFSIHSRIKKKTSSLSKKFSDMLSHHSFYHLIFTEKSNWISSSSPNNQGSCDPSLLSWNLKSLQDQDCLSFTCLYCFSSKSHFNQRC